MRALLPLLLVAAAGAALPSRGQEIDPLHARRAELVAAVHSEFRPAHHFEGAPGVAVVISGTPVVLPPEWTIDVETGSGHGAALTFLRFERRGGAVQVEEVAWRGRTIVRKGRPTGTVRRAQLTDEEVRPLVEAVALLPTLLVTEVKPAKFPRRGGNWRTSGDFRAQVRLLDAGDVPLYTRTYTGYPSSSDQFEYLALDAVVDLARRVLPGDARFARLPVEQLRESHFGAAFALDGPHLTDDFCWWVLEESVEALGFFGDSGAVPVLERLLTRGAGGVAWERRGGKIEAVLASPGEWLSGPPRSFPE